MAKIISLSELYKFIEKLHRQGKRVVLATGVFDLFHSQHQKFLEAASKRGDILLVGLETDERIKRLKGRQRPVWNLARRLEALARLKEVAFVFPLPEKFDTQSDYNKFMSLVRPDILAISSHTPFQKNKKELTEKYGGKMKVVLKYNSKISTTKILQKQKDSITDSSS